MSKTVLLITHRFIPFSLQNNLLSETAQLLPHQYETFPNGDVCVETRMILDCFEQAKRAGYNTICLGTEQMSTVSDERRDYTNALPDISKRLQHLGIDYSSGWETFEWNSYAHDLQMIQECMHILTEQNETSTFICLNLLSCRDTLLLSFFDKPQPVSITVTDDRLDIHPDVFKMVPSTVSQRAKFACAFNMARQSLVDIASDLTMLLGKASECGALVGMTALSSFALGEHDYFGASPMREGNTSFFASNIKTVDKALKTHTCKIVQAFVSSCINNEQKTIIDNLPMRTLTDVGVRSIFMHNDHFYSSVGGMVFDMSVDPYEQTDVRRSLEHIEHVIPQPQSTGPVSQKTPSFRKGMMTKPNGSKERNITTDHDKLSELFPLIKKQDNVRNESVETTAPAATAPTEQISRSTAAERNALIRQYTSQQRPTIPKHKIPPQAPAKPSSDPVSARRREISNIRHTERIRQRSQNW